MKVVVTNVFGPLNRGDHELFGALLDLLHERNFEIEAVARDPQLCRDTFTDVVFHEQPGKADKGPLLLQRLLRMFRLGLAVVSPWLPVLSRLLPGPQHSAIAAIRKADLVIACPGGYLEDSRLSLYPQLVQLWVASRARGRLILAPMSIGPIRGKLPRRILAGILTHTDRIFVRETVSADFCAELGCPVVHSNDLAFLNPRFQTPVPVSDTAAQHIAVTAIHWSFPGHDDRDTAQQRYIEAIAGAVGEIATHTGLPVKLIVQVEGDLPTIRQLADRLKGFETSIVHDINTPEKIQAFLQESYCLVASRFHSAIFALAAGCPVVALAYLPKTTGMLRLYKMDDLCFPIDSFSAAELSQTLIRWGDDREGFRERCAELRQNLREVGDPFIATLDEMSTGTVSPQPVLS